MSRAIFKNPLTTSPLWHVIDATGHHVGRLATKIACLLRGKHKPIYDKSATLQCGDYVVVLNAQKIEFTGKKWDQKLYRKHSGYPGGLKEIKAKDMREKNPEHIIRHAVMGMLPKNDSKIYLGQRLKVYEHLQNPHSGQIAKTPSSSLTVNMGPYIPEQLNPTDEQLKEYFAGYKLKIDDTDEAFSMVETKIKSHKEKLKKERRLLRLKRVNELKPLNIKTD
ncbi:50S ribosomal protein L13 [Tieghemostelium lacteum]|uniref:50S ribosomal protein L13 n=1 Tax=Tieghemostelium lacteum TaxID=361077 RepID=A0A151ZG57_TIELA|nr:50S ribosomal protein L13 [Tieghemostelium lacteum]|eukprot:KYQ92899.1 50S ribosomal protein L13 [Tieghemostelium lacteum]